MKSGVGTGENSNVEEEEQDRRMQDQEEPGESQGLLEESSDDQIDGGGGARGGGGGHLNRLNNKKPHSRSRNFSSSSRDRLELSVMSLIGSRRDPSQDSLLDHEEEDAAASPTHTVKIETPSPNSSQFATPSHGLGQASSEIRPASSCDALQQQKQAPQQTELVPILVRKEDPLSTDQGRIACSIYCPDYLFIRFDNCLHFFRIFRLRCIFQKNKLCVHVNLSYASKKVHIKLI